MNNERIYADPRHVLKYFIPIYLISMIVFYFMIAVAWPPVLLHYILLGAWTLVTAFYIIFANRRSYYVFSKKELKHYRGKQILYYPYKDIWFIDEFYSDKKNSIRFFTNRGDERYIIHDKNKTIYKELLVRCPNLLTKADYRAKFPKIKM